MRELALFAGALNIETKNATMSACPRIVQTATKNSMNQTSTNARTGRSGHGAKSAIASSRRIITPSTQVLSGRKQRRGARQIQIASRNIELPIVKSPTDKRSLGNTEFRLIGSTCKCTSRRVGAWGVNVTCHGQISRTRRTSITATNLERFGGYCATDATRSSVYAKTQLQFSNLSPAT